MEEITANKSMLQVCRMVLLEVKNILPRWLSHLKPYSDGSETEPAKFDFCEKDLELDFN